MRKTGKAYPKIEVSPPSPKIKTLTAKLSEMKSEPTPEPIESPRPEPSPERLSFFVTDVAGGKSN